MTNASSISRRFQLPGITFESNFDMSTSVSITPAYRKTLIGRHLLDVEYAVQSLWHGVFFPKSKRRKFFDRWSKTSAGSGSGGGGGGGSSSRNDFEAGLSTFPDATTSTARHNE